MASNSRSSLGGKQPQDKQKQQLNRWTLNFSSKTRSDRQSNSELPSPPGYTAAIDLGTTDTGREADPSLVVKKSWDIALGPLRQIPMNLFIMYMAGNSISIFPIMMVGMLFLRPFKALFTLPATFKQIEGEQHILQKLIYLVGNVLCIVVALYKCHSMGLLPTHPSDWLDFLEDPLRLEYSGGGLQL